MAASLVEDGDVIFIGGGSTTLTMIKHLANKDIFVVTNSLHHAAELATHNIRCWVTGGSLDPKTGALLGHLALESFANKMFTKSFLGLNGVKNGKLMTTNIREAKLKRMVIEKSEKAYVLFDKSKVGKISVEIFADENEVETIS